MSPVPLSHDASPLHDHMLASRGVTLSVTALVILAILCDHISRGLRHVVLQWLCGYTLRDKWITAVMHICTLSTIASVFSPHNGDTKCCGVRAYVRSLGCWCCAGGSLSSGGTFNRSWSAACSGPVMSSLSSFRSALHQSWALFATTTFCQWQSWKSICHCCLTSAQVTQSL